jgi:phage N-6-adenine-methyltransferase
MSSDDSQSLDLFTSSESDEWATPPSFVRPLADAIGGFDVDPAAGAETSPIADVAFTESDDGLSQPWHGDVWCNPPYSDMADWTAKAVSESRRGDVDSITYLVKGDSSTDWWHRAASAADAVAMIDHRLSFGGGGDAAPFASHVFIFGDVPGDVYRVLERRGAVFRADHYVKHSEQSDLTDYEQEHEQLDLDAGGDSE